MHFWKTLEIRLHFGRHNEYTSRNDSLPWSSRLLNCLIDGQLSKYGSKWHTCWNFSLNSLNRNEKPKLQADVPAYRYIHLKHDLKEIQFGLGPLVSCSFVYNFRELTSPREKLSSQHFRRKSRMIFIHGERTI